jgi:DNA/RNA-binding domain of Phe-tRNA-synthetase-like protein
VSGSGGDPATEPAVQAGFTAPEVRAEFGGLRLRWLSVPGRLGPSPPALRARLRELSNRFRGGNVVAMRTQPVPSAYRAFFRQVGMDPDANRVPSEQVALARLLQGQLRSQDVVADSVLIAVIETGVGVWALDAGHLEPEGPGIRLSDEGEFLGEPAGGQRLPAGRLVIAGRRRVHALLFGEVAPSHAVGSSTTRIALFTVGVDGVPEIHLEEALWTAAEALRAERPGG